LAVKFGVLGDDLVQQGPVEDVGGRQRLDVAQILQVLRPPQDEVLVLALVDHAGLLRRRVESRLVGNRHCPKCQGAAAREWLAAREADLLPVGYFHVVFTVPSEIADIAFHNKAAVYDLLFRTASETMLTIAADPRHLGARIGITAALQTWGGASLRLRQAQPVGEAGGGSALTHHPHIHMIVPGGGISLDGTRWVSSRPAFLLPVHVLAKLFRRLFVSGLLALHAAGQLRFFGDRTGLSDRQEFERYLAPIRTMKWVVYSKPPFGGAEAVLAYLSRYMHRVAIANRRLIALDEAGVTFRYKDYRRDGDARHRTMTLSADEFIRRFLVHVLPKGFHRIRYYGLLASGRRKANLAHARELLAAPARSRPRSLPPPRIDVPPAPAAAGACSSSRVSIAWPVPALRHLVDGDPDDDVVDPARSDPAQGRSGTTLAIGHARPDVVRYLNHHADDDDTGRTSVEAATRRCLSTPSAPLAARYRPRAGSVAPFLRPQRRRQIPIVRGCPSRVRPWAASGRRPSPQTLALCWPASGNLHHVSRPGGRRALSKAAIHFQREMRKFAWLDGDGAKSVKSASVSSSTSR